MDLGFAYGEKRRYCIEVEEGVTLLYEIVSTGRNVGGTPNVAPNIFGS